ncbi:MAG: ATP-binding protein [Actinomycetia bacterium]|nr:ATP-binding protein [Actinomycetes bacterium]
MTRIEPGICETVTGPGTLDEIHVALDEFWLAHPQVPERIRLGTAIAVAEIAANIIEHAGRGKSIGLRMEVKALEDVVEVIFVDDGWEAQLDLTVARLPGDMAERSRGLALAQSVLGELSYSRSGGTNRWTLISERFH